MAFINTPDVGFTLFPAPDGIIPASGATRYYLPVTADQSPIRFTSEDIVSDTKMPNGASNGSTRGLTMGNGSMEMRLQAAPVFDALFESALRGKFTTSGTKTLKPSGQDVQLVIASLLSSSMLDVALGCQVTGFTIDVKAVEGVTISYDLMSLKQDKLTTDNATTVTNLPATATEFNGGDFGTITIAGNTSLLVSEISLSVSQDRTARTKLGINNPLGMAVNGQRQVELRVKAFREDYAVDALLTGGKQSFSFPIGLANNGYGFFLTGNASIPATSLEDGSAFLEFTVRGAYDATNAADFYITKL
jgi:hypothetical protein